MFATKSIQNEKRATSSVCSDSRDDRTTNAIDTTNALWSGFYKLS
jgi:hypothetical protein